MVNVLVGQIGNVFDFDKLMVIKHMLYDVINVHESPYYVVTDLPAYR